MKKILLLVVVLVFCSAMSSLALPQAPQLSYFLNGTSLTIEWSSVPEASGYSLYYTEYPYSPENEIGIADAGQLTSVTGALWDGAAYYLALQTRQGDLLSDLSNVEYFIMQDHDLDWESSSTLGEARSNFGGGIISGLIYTFGGYDANGNLLNTLEIYDPETETWEAGLSNDQALADLTGAVVGESLYLFGATDESCSTTNFAEKYDPETDSWVQLQEKPTAASGAHAVVYDDHIYLFGGWQSNSCADNDKALLDKVESYDPVNNTWQHVTTMPKALEGATVAVVEGRAYVIGGIDAEGNGQTDIMAFDFTTQSWVTSGLGSLAVPRVFPSSSAAPVVDDTVLLVGGWLHESSVDIIENLYRAGLRDRGFVETDAVEFFRPRSRSVVVGRPVPRAIAGHLPVIIDKALYVIGGSSNRVATAETWKTRIILAIANHITYLTSDVDNDGFTVNNGDCNDNDTTVFPGAHEVCGDGLDQDCDGSDLSCEDAISSVSASGQMLRRQVVEGGNSNSFGEIHLERNGAVIQEDDFLGLSVTNSLDVDVALSGTPRLWKESFVAANCINDPCNWRMREESFARFRAESLLVPDDYTVTLEMSDGQLETVIPFAEDVSLPFVGSNSMFAEWQGEDLVLTWGNPDLAPSWDKVNALEIVIIDSSGQWVGVIQMPKSWESFTVTASGIAIMKLAGDGTLETWRIRTQYLSTDANNSELARGNSGYMPIPAN